MLSGVEGGRRHVHVVGIDEKMNASACIAAGGGNRRRSANNGSIDTGEVSRCGVGDTFRTSFIPSSSSPAQLFSSHKCARERVSCDDDGGAGKVKVESIFRSPGRR